MLHRKHKLIKKVSFYLFEINIVKVWSNNILLPDIMLFKDSYLKINQHCASNKYKNYKYRIAFTIKFN